MHGNWARETTTGGSGVTITPLADVIRRSTAFTIVGREVDDKPAGDAWALTTVGKSYDWLGAIGTPWRRKWDRSFKPLSPVNVPWWQSWRRWRFAGRVVRDDSI